jgi:hypothetical protein
MTTDRRLPIDLLLLLLLVSAQMLLGPITLLLVIPLFFYLLLELWQPLAFYQALPSAFGATRLGFLLRLFLLWIMIGATVVLPTISNIFDRLVAGGDETSISEAHVDLHDGALQVEYALAFVRDGKNPYAERYDDTLLRYYGFSNADQSVTVNPTLDYFVYLPGYVVLSYPVFELSQRLGLPYDQRWLYLLSYLLLVLLLPTLVKPPGLKLALVAAVSLNPLLTRPVVNGMNDVPVLLLFVVAVAAFARQRLILSALALGLAATLKQSGWFAAPFFAAWLFYSLPASSRFKQLAIYGAVTILVVAVIIGPFALWDLQHFVTDVFAYPGGSVDVNYPIVGETIGVLLVGAGIIPTPYDPFPFWILQLLLGIPLLAALLLYLRRHNSAGTMLITAAIFILGLGLVSRYFQYNWVGFVIVLISIGLLLNESDMRTDYADRHKSNSSPRSSDVSGVSDLRGNRA